MRLEAGSHLQGGLLVLAGKVCALETGKAGRRQGPSELSLQTGVHQCLASKCPSAFALGTGHTALGFFSTPLLKIQIIKFT